MNFTREQLDVIYYAVTRYRINQSQSLDTFLEASKVTGFYNSKFVDSLRSDISVCEDVQNLLLAEFLSHLDSGHN